ncbi:MAG: D-alanyl-D-alanine carboxypeptidase/D-alanyl-D-alanine-endopeptidase [Planctomycetota bacterium]|nr:D-alanyl-D-alanine carboxypeptidase/D-alanyl-D-alanine-endopeptidase [Planctomycetota bacterium]
MALRSSVLVLTLAAGALGQSLDRRVENVLADSKLRQIKAGVIIMDAQTGNVLAEHRSDEQFIPASNMKLLTSGAALALLGPGFEFVTEIIHDPSAGPAGRVVFRGSGDPTIADPKLLEKSKLTVNSVLERWVSAMKDAGVRPGAELVIDDRVFDREYVHPTWPVEQLNRWYCAEVSGVNFHTNLLWIFTEPLEVGRPPAIKTEPASPWLEIRNRARSVRQGNQTAWAARDPKNNLTLHGDVRFANDPVEVALTDIPNYLGRLLADRMGAAGIEPASVRLAAANETLAGGRVIHTITTPLADVLRRCNVDSYNLYAEALIKRMGHEVTGAPGSWSNGSAVVRMVLQEKVGLDAGQAFTVADGSGMSRNNRVTPRALARWLREMADDTKLADAFIQSLPEAGEEGTLRRRFRGAGPKHEVRAKTGYLAGVSAISGYITDPRTNRRLIFSIVTNDKPNRVQLTAIREAEEKIIMLADAWFSQGANPGAAGSR